MKFFWKGVFLGLFYGIIGNMLVSHYYGFFTGFVMGKFDSLFWWNLIFFFIILCIALFVSYKVWQSMSKIEGFLKAVDEIKKKYHLDNSFKTPKESKREDKVTTPNAEDWKKRIENLIRKVDCECKRKFFTPRRTLSILISVATFSIIAILLIWLNLTVSNAILSYAKTLPSDSQLRFLVEQMPSYANLSISIAALIIAMVVFLPSLRMLTPEEFANWYYGKLSKGVEAKDRPYLKALINVKCREFDLSLWENYQNCIRINCDLFTEESLLQSLLT